MAKEKKKPNWSRKIAALVLVACAVLFMFIMTAINNSNATKVLKTPGIKTEEQHQIFQYASEADKKVKAEASRQFPQWKADLQERKKYVAFANQHYQRALSKIAQHYKISKDDVVKIITEGLENNWGKK